MSIALRAAPVALIGAIVLSGCASMQSGPKDMTFFVTSTGTGKGANLGGVEGADAHC
jgi:hypothetical protein